MQENGIQWQIMIVKVSLFYDKGNLWDSDLDSKHVESLDSMNHITNNGSRFVYSLIVESETPRHGGLNLTRLLRQRQQELKFRT